MSVALYRLTEPKDLIAPTMVAAFDGWVDAGSAATTAAAQMAEGGELVATFEGDQLFDYRARRPTLDIRDGRMTSITWRELTIRRLRLGERDLLVLTGVEPDFRWREFCDAILDIATRLGVAQWLSLGAIPAAVPHTRSVPIIGTESEAGLLRGNVRPGPDGLLRVPAAVLSVLELMMARAGIASVGYFAQVPHYVSGPYPVAALALDSGRRTPHRDQRPGGRARGGGAPARVPPRIRWPRATTRHEPTSSDSNRWSMRNGCRRATS